MCRFNEDVFNAMTRYVACVDFKTLWLMKYSLDGGRGVFMQLGHAKRPTSSLSAMHHKRQ